MSQTSKNKKENKEIQVMDLNPSTSHKKKKNRSNQATAPTNSRNNREFAVITYVFLAMFIFLAGYFIYFMAVKSEDFINSPYNARLDNFSNSVIRGDILSNDGTVLADTVVREDGREVREYPYGNMFAHVVGYSVNGMSGVELDANFNLLRSHVFFLEKLANDVQGEKSQGDNVVTTLDYSLQKTAYEGLGSYNGAVVVMEPSTGKILTMVSKPDYNPNTIEADWTKYTQEGSTNTALLNRATQGLYPPGSTFKIVTLLEYIQENANYNNFNFNCNGAFSNGSSEIHCYQGSVHGSENIYQAFGNSCNSAFASMGLTLDGDKMNKMSHKLLFNQPLPTAFSNTKESRFDMTENSPSNLVMQTAIGQGTTLVTPIHMAMIVSAIANDGVLMKPYVVDRTQNVAGELVKSFAPTPYGSILSIEDARTMQEFMRYVVTDGTGRSLNSDAYIAYGKTGTAEYNTNKDDNHSWFVGYAEDTNGREIAIAVIMEGAGSGSKHAVPLAKSIFDTYFR